VSFSESLVFFHLAKTGGSSIWRALIPTAALSIPPVPIFDLYHYGRCNLRTVTKTPKVLEHFKDPLKKGRTLIHHHTSQPIESFFERPPVYTTIVRDPVDRFISEVNHGRTLLCSGPEEGDQANPMDPRVEIEERGWSRGLIDMAAFDEVSFEDLLARALQEPYLARYYYWTFFHLLLGQPEPFPPRCFPEEGPSNKILADVVRARFSYIGRFPFVYKTYVKIAQTYQMPVRVRGENFPNLLQRNSHTLVPDLRKDLRSAFKEDYEFLSHLGFDFS